MLYTKMMIAQSCQVTLDAWRNHGCSLWVVDTDAILMVYS
jgi:hypothetical protein